ncbi:MAG TPA: hypothetical protein VF916_07335 [Ktedonobacterales bacterium]
MASQCIALVLISETGARQRAAALRATSFDVTKRSSRTEWVDEAPTPTELFPPSTAAANC